MKKITVVLAVTVLVLGGLLAAAGGRGGGSGEMEVTKDPALLVSPTVQVGSLTVYGVKLGDPIEKIPNNAAVTRQPSDRPQDAIYTGRNVSYSAYEGKIYHIRVHGEIARAMPPYNAARLQMLLGKADEVTQPEEGVTALSYFARHVQFTCGRSKLVTSVDLYVP